MSLVWAVALVNCAVIIIIIIIIITIFISIIIIIWEFFTLKLADGFSLEFEWQQAFTNIHDSSLYSVLY